jgi:putative ABC transport system ATP-binding protein
VATLTISDLTISYTSGGYVVRPIAGLDLEVGDGELVLLLGASGCGKTTLLSALASLLRPERGSIRLDDTEITTLSGNALTSYRRRQVGIVFQAFNLVPSLAAVDNVATPMWNAGVGGREARRRAVDLLTRLDLGDRLRHRPADLSGGQQQRVAIARAIALDPPLVLADEPTAHLDFVQVEGVLQLLRTLAQPGRIVVVATHDERLLPLADRVVELSPHGHQAIGGPVRVELGHGQVLFTEGDLGELVFVVEAGTVDLERERADGGVDVVSRYGPGEYFGELAPLFGLRRSATARAVGPAVLVGYGIDDFRRLRRAAAAQPLAAAGGTSDLPAG